MELKIEGARMQPLAHGDVGVVVIVQYSRMDKRKIRSC
jgi:hypothetical protein